MDKFIVKTEDVREFLKEQLDIYWDGYVAYFGLDKINRRMVLLNKHEARFVDNVGNPAHLTGFMSAVDSKGKSSNYYLSVNSFLNLEVMKYERNGNPSISPKKSFEKEWAFFLINKYGDELKQQIVDHHKKAIKEDSDFLHKMLKEASQLSNKIDDEKNLTEEIENYGLSL